MLLRRVPYVVCRVVCGAVRSGAVVRSGMQCTVFGKLKVTCQEYEFL